MQRAKWAWMLRLTKRMQVSNLIVLPDSFYVQTVPLWVVLNLYYEYLN